ncbi:MAG: TonB-dependent receptor [Pseudomonadota bacterium]
MLTAPSRQVSILRLFPIDAVFHQRRAHKRRPFRSLACRSLGRMWDGHLFAILLIATSLYTQASPAGTDVSVLDPSDRTSSAMEEVTVLATRDAFSQRDPRTTVFTNDDAVTLERTPADLLEQMPGVSLTGQGGLLQSYSVRGFSRNRLRTEIIGVPIITDRRAGNSVAFLPPAFIDRTSVNRSAVSSLYGAGAMGGVVSFDLVDPTGFEFSGETRSNDRNTSLSFMANLLTASDGELDAGFSVRQAEDAEDAHGDSLNTEYDQFAAFAQGKKTVGSHQLSATWLVSSGSEIGKSNADFPDRRVSSYPEDRHSVLALGFESNRISLRAFNHYQDWNTRVTRIGERENLTRYRGATWGAVLQSPLQLGGGIGAFGAEWQARRNVRIDEQEQAIPDGLVQAQQLVNADEDILGLFAGQSWIFNSLEVDGSARYDYIRQSAGGAPSDRSDGQWSASVSVAKRLGNHWLIQSELGTAYRFPSLSERFFSGSTPRGEIRGNPGLEPETRRAFEVAIQFSASLKQGTDLGVSLNLYHNELDQYIERVALQGNLFGFRNLDSATLEGLELGGTLETGAFNHRLSYQWQRGEGRDGEPLADLNPPGLRYFATAMVSRFQLSSDLHYRFERSRAGPGEQSLDEALVWNASVKRQFNGGWSGELFVTNVLNEQYLASADDLAPFQPGRTFGVRLALGGATTGGR